MSISSRLKTLGLAAAMLATAIAVAQAEVITAEFEAGGAGADASVTATPTPAPIGHRRRHAGHVPHDAGQDAIVRNEEGFDRRFGMCRRC